MAQAGGMMDEPLEPPTREGLGSGGVLDRRCSSGLDQLGVVRY